MGFFTGFHHWDVPSWKVMCWVSEAPNVSKVFSKTFFSTKSVPTLTYNVFCRLSPDTRNHSLLATRRPQPKTWVRGGFWVPRCCFSKSSWKSLKLIQLRFFHTTCRKKVIGLWNFTKYFWLSSPRFREIYLNFAFKKNASKKNPFLEKMRFWQKCFFWEAQSQKVWLQWWWFFVLVIAREFKYSKIKIQVIIFHDGSSTFPNT